MAERVGFEPSLPFVWFAKSRRVHNMQRILQHTHLIRRTVGGPESGGSSPLSYTDERRRSSDCRTESRSFDLPLCGQTGSHMTTRLPRSRRAGNSPQDVFCKRGKIEIFTDSCPCWWHDCRVTRWSSGQAQLKFGSTGMPHSVKSHSGM